MNELKAPKHLLDIYSNDILQRVPLFEINECNCCSKIIEHLSAVVLCNVLSFTVVFSFQ